MTSPLAQLTGNLMQTMSGGSEFASFFTDDRRMALLRGLFVNYYGDAAASKTVFDTNRTWTGKLALLGELFPQATVICCVREVSWIIDSVERMLEKNPTQPSRLFGYKTGGSLYSRVETLMDPEKGLIGLPWTLLREAWFGVNAGMLVVIKYDSLVQEPGEVIRILYEVLDEPMFPHKFDEISYDAPSYDAHIGMPGMHRVRPKIEMRLRDMALPPDIMLKYAESNFWLKPNLNPRKVKVI
jgi:sulfotransferase